MTPSGTPVGVPPIAHTAFTVRYSGRSLRLTSEVEIFPAHLPTPNSPSGKNYVALYDTGATHSAISPQVVTDLALASIGARNVGVGGGMLATTSHLVNIALPNKVMFPMMQAAKMVLLGGIDAIIGMDILGMGDFTVTHQNGNTTFSFCIPSRKEIDFVAEVKQAQKDSQPRVGRNDPCPCGSGRKYKRCHGA
jgi:predicted aspartyl protease